MKSLFTIITFSLVWSFNIAQSLPSQWKKSEDGHSLIAGSKISNGLYDESQLEEIRLYFVQPNYWTLMTQNYAAKLDILASMKYKGVTYDSIGVRFKGQTSYTMNNSQKKSFNVSMDFARKDQTLGGYKTLNLNNAWQDPSFMREVIYYKLIRNHSPTAKTNFVKVYINDLDWGIYQNVQQYGKDFLKEWHSNNDGINMRADPPTGTTGTPGTPGGGAMWGDGTAAFNYLGADTTLYKKYYTLKSTGISQPWNELMRACDILKNALASTYEQTIQEYFDIDKILWHLACEIAFVDDDSYIFKGKMDYYLYQDAETGRFSTYDYDANSTMKTNNINWSVFYNTEKVNYPLLNKLLAVPAFRQRYLAHMRTIINDLFDENKVNALIDQHDLLIRSAVFADTKKTTSNTQYTAELTVLKNFIKNRKAILLANAEVKAVSPTITDVAHFKNGIKWARINANDEAKVKATIVFGAGISRVNLFYGKGVSGRFESFEMVDDGTKGDDIAKDGIYTGVLPKFTPGNMVKYYIEAIGNDIAKSRTYFPSGAEHQMLTFDVDAVLSTAKTVVINEFMASNTGIIKDEYGDSDDWIELYNTTSSDINISNYYITDDVGNLTKFQLPDNTTLKANSYLIVWADENKPQGPFHTNFKLSATGEVIILSDKNQVILDSISFGPQTANKSAARKPNGTGPFVIGDHTFNANNNGTTSSTQDAEVLYKLYPNPVSDILYIESKNTASKSVKILDLNGKTCLSTVLINNWVDVSALMPGMYLMQLDKENHKLVIIR